MAHSAWENWFGLTVCWENQLCALGLGDDLLQTSQNGGWYTLSSSQTMLQQWSLLLAVKRIRPFLSVCDTHETVSPLSPASLQPFIKKKDPLDMQSLPKRAFWLVLICPTQTPQDPEEPSCILPRKHTMTPAAWSVPSKIEFPLFFTGALQTSVTFSLLTAGKVRKLLCCQEIWGKVQVGAWQQAFHRGRFQELSCHGSLHYWRHANFCLKWRVSLEGKMGGISLNKFDFPSFNPLL